MKAEHAQTIPLTQDELLKIKRALERGMFAARATDIFNDGQEFQKAIDLINTQLIQPKWE